MVEVGTVLEDRYELTAALGTGGAASVFRAWDRQLSRAVAVKVLGSEGPLADPARFLSEAQAMAKLRHPHILEVYGSGTLGRTPYLVLELVTGGSLVDRLDRGAPARAEAVGLARGVLEALAYAHGKGVVHRDVKPANVLLDAEGRAKLSDFGLAKFAGAAQLTAAGVILGTPEFMAPEVLKGHEATAASDLYSWGCLVHTLVHRRPPHEGTPLEIARAATSAWRPTLVGDPCLDQAMLGALQPDPARRARADRLLAVLDGGSLAGPGAAATLELARPSTGSLMGAPLGAQGPARTRGLALGGAVLALLVSAYLLLGREGPEPGPIPTTDPAGPPAADPDTRPERVTLWRERLGEMEEPAAFLRRLHGELFAQPDADHRGPRHMAWELIGRPEREHRDPGRHAPKLAQAAGTLPLKAALDQDREALLVLLADPAIPFKYRRELHQGLSVLGALDAYFEALGAPPPHRTQEVLDALFPVRWTTVDKGARDSPLGADERLLFAWEAEDDRRYPWVLSEGEFPSEHEKFQAAMLQSRTRGGWQPAPHAAIEARIGLTRDEAARGARLAFLVSNLLPAHMIRVAWNTARIDLHRPARPMSRADWDERMFPEYEASVRLPPEALEAGENRLRISCATLPGVPPLKGFQVDRVVLTLGR